MQSQPSEMARIRANVPLKRSLKGSVAQLENRPELRKPYLLTVAEQERLFNELPIHLRQMAIFQVNTGCREKELCELQWSWERKVASLNTSVFVIPCHGTEGRLVVLNDGAKAILEEQRGLHPTHVFAYQGHPVGRMNRFLWNHARQKVGLPQIRVYDLRLTFDRRLEEAGVGFKERQDLLGHRRTPDYSHDQLCRWMHETNKACHK
jgi:integrase